MTITVDQQDLETRVKGMYRDVAENPHGDFHFELGRGLAERLGYPPGDLDRIPSEAVDSFAGVGYYFGLRDVAPGERVLDLGSGSGLDVFVAALRVGPGGSVVGLDMTREQLAKAIRLRDEAGFGNVDFVEGQLESLPFADASFDTVISNGVINLCADKGHVFREAARVLRPGGSLVLSDIVSELPLPESIVCNATLWAACIGGALEQGLYARLAEEAGLVVERKVDNTAYRFLSNGAQGATDRYGVKSISLHARKPVA
jgi:ubiquinone/menaquinone biosynthesis C-methylase UbiE